MLPETRFETAAMLMEVIYTGSVEASLGDLRDIILLARSLRVQIPVSDELLELLEVPPEEERDEDEEEEDNDDEVETDRKRKRSSGVKMQPPPLKRIKTSRPNMPVEETSNGTRAQPAAAASSSGYLCPFCNAKYHNSVAFKNHLKFHESEALKEQRSQMMSEMVATCFGKNYSS